MPNRPFTLHERVLVHTPQCVPLAGYVHRIPRLSTGEIAYYEIRFGAKEDPYYWIAGARRMQSLALRRCA